MRIEKYRLSEQRHATQVMQTVPGDEVVLVMDNGERISISEVRVSASRCELQVSMGRDLVVKPRFSNVIRIGQG